MEWKLIRRTCQVRGRAEARSRRSDRHDMRWKFRDVPRESWEFRLQGGELKNCATAGRLANLIAVF